RLITDINDYIKLRSGRLHLNRQPETVSNVLLGVQRRIADLAADVRAATPSAAAELVVPVLAELQRQLTGQKNRLMTAYQQHRRRQQERLEALAGRPVLMSPRGFLELRKRLLDQTADRLSSAGRRWIRHKRERLNSATAQLTALSPLAVLSRGYAVCRRLPRREILFSSDQAAPGDLVEVRLAQGELLCRVEDSRK
ncbi:MAG: exodeoxyribonuclease VII large subunit, partial [Syntrophomonadaceae bacterium]|nr:exodeoxyribonuclease VII large subunit [Syntrophomonadaceae bacterium]